MGIAQFEEDAKARPQIAERFENCTEETFDPTMEQIVKVDLLQDIDMISVIKMAENALKFRIVFKLEDDDTFIN